MSILVASALGFTGSHVIIALLLAGSSVPVIGNLSTVTAYSERGEALVRGISGVYRA